MTDNSKQAAGPSTYSADDIDPNDLAPKQVHRLQYNTIKTLHAAVEQKFGPEILKVAKTKEAEYLQTHGDTPEARTRLLVEGNREMQKLQDSDKVKTGISPDKKATSRFSSPST